VAIDDAFFRVCGAETGTAATAFIDIRNNSIIDDVWAWRADHGSGGGLVDLGPEQHRARGQRQVPPTGPG
jgi:hypothetical protein